jgi:hypothetical protein
MLIQIRQKEIETAIQMYIAAQGITLKGKSVVIAFTAGRRDSGLTADVDIVDTAPSKDFSEHLAAMCSPEAVAKSVQETVEEQPEAEAPVQEAVCAESVEEEKHPEVDTAIEVKTASLFS